MSKQKVSLQLIYVLGTNVNIFFNLGIVFGDTYGLENKSFNVYLLNVLWMFDYFNNLSIS